MDLRRLRYVVALAEHQNFGRAAASLGIKQPSLSQQINAMESELQLRLFERGTGGVSLTAAGEAFLVHARHAIEYFELAVVDAERAARGESGDIAVSFLGSATYTILPRVLREFRRLHPGLRIRPSELTTARQGREIVDGHLDLGFIRPPLLAEQMSLLRYLPVARETLVVALPSDHPLARRSEIPISVLSTEALILPPRSDEPGSYDSVQRACAQFDFQPLVAAEASQLHTILGLVAGGVGIAIGPSSFQRVPRPDVVCRRLTPRTFMPDLTMIWRKDDRSGAVRNFVNLVSVLHGVVATG
jgi:DNA-binding transcriptional LysR family regulator